MSHPVKVAGQNEPEKVNKENKSSSASLLIQKTDAWAETGSQTDGTSMKFDMEIGIIPSLVDVFGPYLKRYILF